MSNSINLLSTILSSIVVVCSKSGLDYASSSVHSPFLIAGEAGLVTLSSMKVILENPRRG